MWKWFHEFMHFFADVIEQYHIIQTRTNSIWKLFTPKIWIQNLIIFSNTLGHSLNNSFHGRSRYSGRSQSNYFKRISKMLWNISIFEKPIRSWISFNVRNFSGLKNPKKKKKIVRPLYSIHSIYYLTCTIWSFDHFSSSLLQ